MQVGDTLKAAGLDDDQNEEVVKGMWTEIPTKVDKCTCFGTSRFVLRMFQGYLLIVHAPTADPGDRSFVHRGYVCIKLYGYAGAYHMQG